MSIIIDESGVPINVVGLAESMLFPELESDWFWLIVGGILSFSVVGLSLHLGVLKKRLDFPPFDKYFNTRRAKLVEAYFGSKEGGEERNSLFVGLPTAMAFGFFGVGTLLLKVTSEDNDAAFILICLLYLGGVFSYFVFARRKRSGPPKRIKPSWLIEEERRRQKAGEIVWREGGWEKNPKSCD